MGRHVLSVDIILGLGGAVDTCLMPYRILRFLAFHPNVSIRFVVTAGALDFVTNDALRAISKQPVYAPGDKWDPLNSVPIHRSFSAADLLVVHPATARLIAETANGIISCPVTRTFAFFPKDRIVLGAAIHPQMDERLYRPAIDRLRSVGCKVVEAKTGEDHWGRVEQSVVSLLDLPTSQSSGQVVELFPRE